MGEPCEGGIWAEPRPSDKMPLPSLTSEAIQSALHREFSVVVESFCVHGVQNSSLWPCVTSGYSVIGRSRDRQGADPALMSCPSTALQGPSSSEAGTWVGGPCQGPREPAEEGNTQTGFTEAKEKSLWNIGIRVISRTEKMMAFSQ